MSRSLVQNSVHIIFSTKKRYPFIDNAIQEELWAYIKKICNLLGCTTFCVGGYNDHIHICCMLSKNITSGKLLEDIKRKSSKWIKSKGEKYKDFYWQEGYGLFSITPSEIENIIRYINGQSEHHKKGTYEAELLILLKENKVEYDERNLYD